VVIMDFWATWCGPCRMAMPALQSFQQKHAKHVEVLSINQLENAERVAAFVKANNLQLHVLLDQDGAVSSAYRVFGIPTLYVVDKTGILRQKYVGYRQDLEQLLEQVITPLL
ncbi:MAG: TlpA disulfide reductase family protein, partial [bacterium]